MTKREFINICKVFGLGLPFYPTISSCNDSDNQNTNFAEKVLIIGAGAGGLSAGYFLHQRGIDFEILEASSNYGGRMKRTVDFADFPIPLGAEWLHTNPSVFDEIVNDGGIQADIQTIGYTNTDTLGIWDNGELTVMELTDSDRKFVNSTWFDFFESYIVDSVRSKIRLNEVVSSIDYSDSQIVITTQTGQLTTDRVIISVPLKILQDGNINFIPVLPSDKRNAINSATVWDGFKAFFEFSDKFYHTATSFNIVPETDGQKLYYDAAYGQDTDKHILGLFVVGKPVEPYASRSGNELRDYVLNELDEIYDDMASSSYRKHIVQNWNDEPFIRAGYLSDHEPFRNVRKLGESVNDQIFFAGGPYTNGDDWVSVHAAALSAKRAVEELVRT